MNDKHKVRRKMWARLGLELGAKGVAIVLGNFRHGYFVRFLSRSLVPSHPVLLLP